MFVILSAILFGVMPLLAKVSYSHGSNAYTVAFGRFFFGSVMLGIIIFILPNCSARIDRKQLKEIIKLSVCYAFMPILLYSSYNFIDSGTATTLHFTYPIAVMLIMSIFCKVRMEAKQIVCAVFCIAGLALIYTPGGQASILGIALAIVSGVVYAIYIVLLGKSSAKELHPLTLAFWISVFSAIEIGVIAFLSGNLVFHLDKIGWFSEVVMALFTTVFALVLFQKGLFLCGEVKASLLSTFEPITGIIVGVVVFNETLSTKESIGMVGILGAATLLVIPRKKKRKGDKTNNKS